MQKSQFKQTTAKLLVWVNWLLSTAKIQKENFARLGSIAIQHLELVMWNKSLHFWSLLIVTVIQKTVFVNENNELV